MLVRPRTSIGVVLLVASAIAGWSGAACRRGVPAVTSGTRPVAAAAPTPFDTAELAAVNETSIVLYSLAGDRLRELQRVSIPQLGKPELAPFMAPHAFPGAWAGRDALFVHAGPRRVVRLTAAGLDEVVMPPAATFELPRPDDPDATEFYWEALDVIDGEAWFGHCPWGLPYDAGDCLIWVWARLGGEPERIEELSHPHRAPTRAWPVLPAPAGITLETVETDGMPTGLRCTSASERSVFESNRDEAEVIDEGRWVAQDPPVLLVTRGAYGLDDLNPTRWSLHEGCKGTPLATGSEAEPGPDGLWIGHQADGLVLRRGAHEVGSIPGWPALVFRPR